MIDRSHALPVSQQVRLVGIARSSAYYQARPLSDDDQRLMRRIDELHLEFPFAGARMLARLLRREGHEVGRRRVRTLMKRMGVEALYCRPNTSRRNAKHKIWPYLLRGLKIDRANQAWALDTTYIPMACGFVYLTAVVDWASRKILAHRVAITLEPMCTLLTMTAATGSSKPSHISPKRDSSVVASLVDCTVLRAIQSRTSPTL